MRHGQYVSSTVQFRRKLKVDGKSHTFAIFNYGAKNAFGIVGTEYNGVAIVNETANCVVLDGEASQPRGWYHGTGGNPIPSAIRVADIQLMSAKEFRAFVVSHHNYRGALA